MVDAVQKADSGSGHSPVRKLLQIGAQINGILQRSRDEMIEEIIAVYGVGLQLKKSGKAWTKFCKNPYWTGKERPPRANQRSEALRFALRVAMGEERRRRQRASYFYRILASHFSGDVTCAELRDRVKGRGLSALKRPEPHDGTHQALAGAAGKRALRPVMEDVRRQQTQLRVEEARALVLSLLAAHRMLIDRDALDDFISDPQWRDRRVKPHHAAEANLFQWVFRAVVDQPLGRGTRHFRLYRAALPIWSLLQERARVVKRREHEILCVDEG